MDEVPVQALLSLARFLSQRRSLDALLVSIVERASQMLGVHRASIRVLDPDRRKLVATCRNGEPLHEDPRPFALGEGLLGWVAANEAVLRLAEPETDPRFVRRADITDKLGSFLAVPLIAGAGCLGVLSFASQAPGYFTERHETVALLIAAMVAPHLEVARLARLSNLDPLTGLLNRRGLDAVSATLDHDARAAGSFAVVMADIDHFKDVNDTHGHDAGDRVLRLVAETLSTSVRRGDSVGRAGGEEFVMMLIDADLEMAARIAERARERIARSAVEVGPVSVRVTASFGVAVARPGERAADVVQRADRAMYEAKRGGRNRVARA